MVRLAREDLVRPVELLDEHHARELVRERHRAERELLVTALELRPVRPADDEADVAPAAAPLLEPARERHRVARAFADLDELDLGVAGQHALVVLDVVGERRPHPADRDHRVLHRSNAFAWPIRWIVDGCVPSRKRASAGGSGSETFLTEIRCWKSM